MNLVYSSDKNQRQCERLLWTIEVGGLLAAEPDQRVCVDGLQRLTEQLLPCLFPADAGQFRFTRRV